MFAQQSLQPKLSRSIW